MIPRPRAAVARAQAPTSTFVVSTSTARDPSSRAAPAPSPRRLPSSSPPPIVRPTPTRVRLPDAARSQATAGPSSSRPRRAAGATAVANIKHLYEAHPPDLDAESDGLEQETPSRRARGGARRAANTNTRQEVIVIDDDDTADFWDVDDSFIRQIDEVEARAVSSGSGRGTRGRRNVETVYDLSSEFDLNEAALMDLEAIEARSSGQNGASSGRETLELEEEFGWEGDDSFVRHVEAVESRVSRKDASAAHRTHHVRSRDTKTNATMPSSGTRGPQMGTGSRKRRIIMESDDEGEGGGKENRPEVIVIDD